jgi:hypothetical protein
MVLDETPAQPLLAVLNFGRGDPESGGDVPRLVKVQVQNRPHLLL